MFCSCNDKIQILQVETGKVMYSLHEVKIVILDSHTIPRDTKDNRHIVAMLVSQNKEIINILLLRVHQHSCHDIR